MAQPGQSRPERLRVYWFFGIVSAVFIVLIGRLFFIQMLSDVDYEARLAKQSIRSVRLPGGRGRVFDRYGQVLCDNKPSYCISIYIDELRRPGLRFDAVKTVDELVDQLSDELGVPRQLSKAEIETHTQRRIPLPIVAWRDVPFPVIARLQESVAGEGAVAVEVVPMRTYPQGQVAAHILGYASRVRPSATPGARRFNFLMPELVGRAGIERVFNDELSGVEGEELLRVDVIGFTHDRKVMRKPISGNDIHLTIDVELQKAVETVLAGRRGAAVLVDPRNGDILAMASAPTYDLNLFSPRISHTDWKRLNENPDLPLLNRTVSALYPPGSIFKPVIALTALKNSVIRPSALIKCTGVFSLANIRCWRRSGHGPISMRKAIEQSCNCYFCELGLRCTYDAIYHMAEAFRLGKRTGVEGIEGEAKGLLPTDEWSRKRRGVGWRKGDTANISIGQGDLLVTPLQMAMVAATLANGGNVYRPRLTLQPGEPGALLNRLNLSAEMKDVVRGGMHDVVQSPTGTGRHARIFGVEMGGKTGTAEYKKHGETKKHTWMIAFAPFDNPRYAIAMVIEDGQSGGRTVGPRIKRVMETVFQLEAVRGVEAGI